jgi:hypothetical protein
MRPPVGRVGRGPRLATRAIIRITISFFTRVVIVLFLHFYLKKLHHKATNPDSIFHINIGSPTSAKYGTAIKTVNTPKRLGLDDVNMKIYGRAITASAIKIVFVSLSS